jgi:peroxiredoxin
MGQNVERIRKEGLGLAAISYDSPAILKNFADRRKIAFPLLSDPDSLSIRSHRLASVVAQCDGGARRRMLV